MTLNKQSGNMYGFITHTLNPLIGGCSGNCSYCSTNKLKKRFPSLKKRYSGKPRLDEKQFHNLGKGKTIFVCAQNDLFADGVPSEYAARIINHCIEYPDNTYYFQTKNLEKLYKYLYYTSDKRKKFIMQNILCCTIETDSEYLLFIESANTHYFERISFLKLMCDEGYRMHVTIEPIMGFSMQLAKDIIKSNPDQVNIGADSGDNDLPEPSWQKVQKLITELENNGIKVWQKKNLERLKNDSDTARRNKS